MRKVTNCRAAVVLALVLAAVLAPSASANHLSLNSRTFRTTAAELTFAEETGSISTVCSITLEGSMSSATFAKVAEAQVGSLTAISAAEAACIGEGEISFERTELPTAVKYETFAGTLPRITQVGYKLIPPEIVDRIGPFRAIICRYRPGGPGDFFRWTYDIDGFGNQFRTGYRWSIAGIVRNSISCPRILTVTGQGNPTRSAEGTTIRVSLI